MHTQEEVTPKKLSFGQILGLLCLGAWMTLSSTAVSSDTQAPIITPGFSDNQSFETLQDLYVSLTDDHDTNPDLSEVNLSDLSSGSIQSLTALFDLACPTGFAELDGQCLQKVSEPPVPGCPDGFTLSGSECTKRVVERVSPASECPVGFSLDTGTDPNDILSECIKIDTANVILTCSDDSHILIDDACYSEKEVQRLTDYVNDKYRYSPPYYESPQGTVYTDIEDFYSELTETYYLPPSQAARADFADEYKDVYSVPRASCPEFFEPVPENAEDYTYGLEDLHDAGIDIPGNCWFASDGIVLPDDFTGSQYSYSTSLETGDACEGKVRANSRSPTQYIGSGKYYLSGATPRCVIFEDVLPECPSRLTFRESDGSGVIVSSVDTSDVGLDSKLGDVCAVVGSTSPRVNECNGYGVEYNEDLDLCVDRERSAIQSCPDSVDENQTAFGTLDTKTIYGTPFSWLNYVKRSYSDLAGSGLAPEKCWALTDVEGLPDCPDGSSYDAASDSCISTSVTDTESTCQDGFALENGLCTKQTSTPKVRSNTARIDLPVLTPGEYSLSLTAVDETGNEASKSLSFVYRPRGFSLKNGSNTLQMPSVALALSRLDGRPALVTDVLTDSGQVLTGSHPVYATLVGGSEIPLMVEGTLVEQGKTVEVAGSFDMDATGGRLELNVAPYYEGVQGESSLMLTVGESGSLVSVFDVKTWTFQPSMSVTPTDPIALFGQMDIRASGAGCTPVATREKAMQYDVFDAPACYIRWNQVPAGLSSESGIPSLTGVLDNAGEQTAGFEAVLVEPNGIETVVGSYSESFSAVDFYGSISFKMTGNEKPVLAGVDEKSYSVSQSEGPSCLPAASEEEALSLIGGQSLVCFIEWVNPPSSMDPIKVQGAPALRGAVPEIGENVLSWRVNLFDSGGQKVVVNEQSATVIGEEPETPNVVITADATYETPSGSVLNLASPNSSYDAFVAVTGADAPMSVQMLVDGVEVYNEFHESRFGDTNRVTVPLALPDANLWDSQNLEVRVAYETMPGYTSDVSAQFLTVPSAGIEPELDSRYLEAVNTGSSPLTITMTGRNGDPYDMDTMGQWQARLVKEVGFQRYEPVTDFVTLTGAETTSNLDFNEMMEPGEVARIMVEAQLISPIPEYQRTTMSRYPTSIALLDGSAIEGSVQATRMSGSAPVRGIFTLALDDRDARDALESVTWEVSSDGGATWVVQEEGVRGHQLRRSFDTGDYLLRTKTVNKHTGEEFTTEPLRVTAYTRPDIDIAAPASAFIGSNVSLSADLKDDDGNLLNPDDFILEWSTDNGDTFEVGGPSISLTSSERTDIRVILRARDKRAPEEDYRAYAQSRAPLAFRAVKPPRVYIRGTRAAEVGQEVTLKASVSAPYLRMADEVKGYWVLPDGTTSEAEELTMTAPRLPEGENYLYVDYVAWVDGYRGQGAEITRSHRMRFWEYKFPEFRIEARQTADVAPVEISAYVRPLGFTGNLDDPQYEWQIPDGVEITWDRTARARVMKIEQPGTYTLQAKVTDSRGNEAITTRTFNIGVPEPLSVDMEVRGRTALRAPYEILVRPIITGGHPRDYYEDYVYEVNGQVLESSSRYGRITLPEGSHTVKLNVTTRMGEKSSGSFALDVPPNTPPTCDLTHWESYGSWRLNADCSDVDGRVKEYVWEFDGEPLAISSSRISVPSSIFNGKPAIDVILKARDDSDEYSPEVQVNLHNLNP